MKAQINGLLEAQALIAYRPIKKDQYALLNRLHPAGGRIHPVRIEHIALTNVNWSTLLPPTTKNRGAYPVRYPGIRDTTIEEPFPTHTASAHAQADRHRSGRTFGSRNNHDKQRHRPGYRIRDRAFVLESLRREGSCPSFPEDVLRAVQPASGAS